MSASAGKAPGAMRVLNGVYDLRDTRRLVVVALGRRAPKLIRHFALAHMVA